MKAFKEAEEMKGARERERKGGERGEERGITSTSNFSSLPCILKVTDGDILLLSTLDILQSKLRNKRSLRPM